MFPHHRPFCAGLWHAFQDITEIGAALGEILRFEQLGWFDTRQHLGGVGVFYILVTKQGIFIDAPGATTVGSIIIIFEHFPPVADMNGREDGDFQAVAFVIGHSHNLLSLRGLPVE